MSDVALYTTGGDRTGTVQIPAGLLVEHVHKHVLWEAVKGHLANQRQGTHKTKTRHEVNGQKSMVGSAMLRYVAPAAGSGAAFLMLRDAGGMERSARLTLA